MFLRLAVSNSDVWGLVFLRLGKIILTSSYVLGVKDVYVLELVLLRLGVSFHTFGG